MSENTVENAQTPVGNTGLNVKEGFVAKVDWLDLVIDKLHSGDELSELLEGISIILGESLPYPDGKPEYKGCYWRHTARSAFGVQLHYNPPTAELKKPFMDAADWPERLKSWQRMLPDSDAPLCWEYVQMLGDRAPAGLRLVWPKLSCPVDGMSMSARAMMAPPHHGFIWEMTEERTLCYCGRVRVSIPGAVLATCDQTALLAYLHSQKDVYGIRATRIDCCVDDELRTLKFEDIASAVSSGNYAHARIADIRSPLNMGRREGWTVYFGSSKSDSRTRIYDKAYESKLENTSIRVERQLRDESAESVFYQLCHIADNKEQYLGEFISSFAVSGVDFVERENNKKRLSKMSRLPWWQRFLDSVATPLKVVVPKKRTTIQKKINWFSRQASKSVAMIAGVIGIPAFMEFVKEALKEGEAAFKPCDQILVATTSPDDIALDADSRYQAKVAMKEFRQKYEEWLPDFGRSNNLSVAHGFS